MQEAPSSRGPGWPRYCEGEEEGQDVQKSTSASPALSLGSVSDWPVMLPVEVCEQLSGGLYNQLIRVDPGRRVPM